MIDVVADGVGLEMVAAVVADVEPQESGGLADLPFVTDDEQLGVADNEFEQRTEQQKHVVLEQQQQHVVVVLLAGLVVVVVVVAVLLAVLVVVALGLDVDDQKTVGIELAQL